MKTAHHPVARVRARRHRVVGGARLARGHLSRGSYRRDLRGWLCHQQRGRHQRTRSRARVEGGSRSFNGVALDGLTVMAAVAGDANLGVHEIGGDGRGPGRRSSSTRGRPPHSETHWSPWRGRCPRGWSATSWKSRRRPSSSWGREGRACGQRRLPARRTEGTRSHHVVREQAVVQPTRHRASRRDGHDARERVQRRLARHEVE